MTPRVLVPDETSAPVSAQEFGAMQATLEITVKALDKHLKDCYQQNAEVAKNVRNLTIAVAVLAFAVLGEEKILSLVKSILT